MVNGALGARAVTSVVPCPEGGRESKLPHAVIESGTTRDLLREVISFDSHQKREVFFFVFGSLL